MKNHTEPQVEDDHRSLAWLKEPAFLVTVLTILLYYAGLSFSKAYFGGLHLRPGEIMLDVEQYMLQGALPALIFFVLPGMLISAAALMKRRPGPVLGAFLIVYPALVMATSHVVDNRWGEATAWTLLALVAGIFWFRRIKGNATFLLRDWFLRVTYALVVILAAGHVGSALGHVEAADFEGAPIRLEMTDVSHPLHNQTLALVIHHDGNYYLREISADPKQPTYIVSEALVARASALPHGN